MLVVESRLKHHGPFASSASPVVKPTAIKITPHQETPSTLAGYHLAPKVARLLRVEGIKEIELREMLSRAAITSLQGFNRRYHSWVFKLTGKMIEDMAGADPVKTGKGRDTQMREDCEHCRAQGCRECAWYGWILRRI